MIAECYHHYRRVAAGTVPVVCSPTFQLSNFPAFRLIGFSTYWLVGLWLVVGLRVLGYSEALMRISERGCIRAAE